MRSWPGAKRTRRKSESVRNLLAASFCAFAFITPAQAEIFSNSNQITINDAGSIGPGSPYPSDITVSGMSGNVTKVTVTLHNLNHTFPDDIDVLLVGPGGNLILMSDVGGGADLIDTIITFDDAAAESLPDSTQIVSGTFKPTNNPAVDTFPAPAPAPSANTTLAASFNDTAANGTWRLYVVDDSRVDVGLLESGWTVTITTTGSPATSFANGMAIFINDPVGQATPYPSTINVSGLTNPITRLKVTLTNITHSSPDDLDILLVAPGGERMLLMSDRGGSPDLVNVTITLDDAAATALPDNTIIASGTFRPANSDTSDTIANQLPPYPSPETAGTATLASIFNGAEPNGTWQLYVIDDLPGSAGNINGGWSLEITQAGTVPAPGQLIISEFRLRGPGGSLDEFIEIYNTTSSPFITQSSDGSPGLGILASDLTLRCTIPNGTTIPANGHFLCANNLGYSISNYPAGNNGVSATTATADATFTIDIPDNAGIALFSSTTTFNGSTKLDAVGSIGEPNAIFKEGTGYPNLAPANNQVSFYRKHDPMTGLPIDTNNNATDFFFVDPEFNMSAAGQRLGAPGPENLTSPTLNNPGLPLSLLDSCVAASEPPNQVRDLTNDPLEPNDSFGKLELRRTVTNNTGANLTRLRFRVIDFSTFPSNADLRALTSGDISVAVDREPCGGSNSNVTVHGTILETPPNQPNGGGFNSSLSAGTITLATPLAPGATIDVRFVFGVQATGPFRIVINVEALPPGEAGPLRIVSIDRPVDGHVFLEGTGVPNTAYTMQASPDLSAGSFTGIGPAVTDIAGAWQFEDMEATGLTKQFYRLAFPPHRVEGDL